MKKIALTGIVMTSFLCSQAMADVSASSTATWDASATKDTTSSIVVTPLKSLSFQYAEGMQAFNQQNGAFDITIQGQSGATDFKLTSQLVSNTLTRTSDASTLDVGVLWNGQKLSKTTPVTLLDVGSNAASPVSAGLDALAVSSAYAGAGRTSTTGIFTFNIASATSDGTTKAEFKDLNDGYWSGDVKVQFNAVWAM